MIQSRPHAHGSSPWLACLVREGRGKIRINPPHLPSRGWS